jgi:6-phosphogluconolactonase
METLIKSCEINIYPDAETLAEAAARSIVAIAAEALRAREKFSIVLAGGSTPKSLYRLLASDQFKDEIEWRRALVFFGDERCVSPDSEQSNYRMASENLLSRISISPENVFRQRGEIEPEKAAAEYQEIIKENLGSPPQFDLVLLGVGDDGHTASLFPNSPALEETEKLVAANFVEKLNAYRLTLTLPAINSARNVIFLATGASKADAVKKIFSVETYDLPAGLVKPEDGHCRWFLDQSAAEYIR